MLFLLMLTLTPREYLSASRLGVESSDADQAVVRIDHVRLVAFISKGLQTDSVLHFFAQSSTNPARSLHAVLAAIKASSVAAFDAPARAVSTSLGDSRSRPCGPGTFLSFQHTSTGADMCTWAAGASSAGASVIVTRQDDAGTCVASLRCPDGAALIDAQFYKDEQLAVLVSAPEGACRLEIVDCARLTFRLLADDVPLNGAKTGPSAHAHVYVLRASALTTALQAPSQESYLTGSMHLP
jgi:hypothetical protein